MRYWKNPASHGFKREIRNLKRLLAEKVLEMDFFKSALQQIEVGERENRRVGELSL